MALAIDASSPAATTGTTNTRTTASFTPPAGSLVVVIASIGNSTGSGAVTSTVTDSVSSTWTRYFRLSDTGFGCVEVWFADVASATARTVTCTGSASNAKGVQVATLVFTGAKSATSQAGQIDSYNTASSTWNSTIQPLASGSCIVGGLVYSPSNITLVPVSGQTTILSTSDATNGETYGSFRTGILANTNTIAYGYTNTSGGVKEIVAVEVQAGSTVTNISAGDTGSGADAVNNLAVRLSSADTGSGSEAASLAVTLAAADTGSGVDSAMVAVRDGDMGSGTEGAAVGVPISASDSGTFTDAEAALSATLTASDAGTLVDIAAIARPASDGDTGTGTDAVVRIALNDGDTGTAVDAAAVSNAVVGAETGSFTDTASKGFGTSDTGTVTDAGSLVARFQAGDTGTFADKAVSIVKTGQFFRPPTVTERFRFAGRTTRTQSVGVTILKKSGSYTSILDPTAEQVTAADIAYLGGRDYLIDDTEKAALIAAGYGSYIVSLTIP